MNPSLSPEQRAGLLIAQMTLEQKVQQISNDTRPAMNPANRPPGCEFTAIGRHIQGIPELGIPTVRMVNGGTGVRGGSCLPEPVATALPSTPGSAATFNRELNRRLGEILGDEARRHGHQVMLAPGMNLHRHPYGGRNYEYQSEDPYLSGVMAVEQIRGIEAHGIHANAKHFAGNEQETQRRQMATRIPPRALHELYLLPFEMAVRDAQPASVMCAFPEINGVSACSNAELLQTTLRERWGFGGYVVSDRRAVHDVGPSIKAGVDWELAHMTPLHYSLHPQPGQRGNPGSEGIRAALAAGTITIADIDQMLRRRYIQMFRFGHFETNFDVLFQATPDFISHGLIAREIAEQGIVLLKNEHNFLPLNAVSLNSVALIGAEWFAGQAKLPPRSTRADNVNVVAPYTVSPQQGLENVLRALGSAATVTYESGGGTGTQADRDRAVALAQRSDVVIVMVGDNPHELCDRETLRLPIIPPADPRFCAWDEIAPGEEEEVDEQGGRTVAPERTIAPDLTRNTAGEFQLPSPPRGTGTDQEALMRELVAAPGVAQKMVVVLKTEGMVLMPWLEQVPALLQAWYPGQEDGNAVANILFGLRNPSGKLPMTFGSSPTEAAHATTEQFPGVFIDPPHWLDRPRLEAQYLEGLQVGYRWYEANNVRPVFSFGFGLSYTTFAYSGLAVATSTNAQTGDPVLTVTYTITNTGNRQGAEASQVYLTLPPEAGQPSKRLVGFQKVDLMPGESRQVTATIDGSASNHPFSYWVPENDAPAVGWSRGSWATAPGAYTVHVGTSSADTPLQQTVALSGGTSSAACTTTRPGAGWVCLNGGWLPPGHPSIVATPACTTPSPGPGWVCLDGGWLPPGHPGIGAAPGPAPTPPVTPTGCTTPTPGAGWVCVNGGWLPPGHPGIGAAPGPAPPPPVTPTGCTTPTPGAGWVCVNGGWLPPGHPGIGAAPGPAPIPPVTPTPNATGCATSSPGAGWVCVNGGWVPQGHPLAGGEQAPTPQPPVGATPSPPSNAAPAPSAGCTTPAPAQSWVCLEGGWLPPDHPLVVIEEIGETDGLDGPATPPSTTPSACLTEPPAAGWLCVNGGWVPPGHPLAANVPIPPLIDPPLIIEDTHLARVRDSLRRGEPEFAPALSALEAEANRALTVAPMSVMDKQVTPPSGDKHDYMSQAPYWWPDPSRPDGRPYIRRDGQRSPEIDRITDRDNLGRLTRSVSALALAYYFTGREDYAQHAARLVRVWFLDPATRMNPHLQFAQGIPGIAEGRAAGIIETRLLPDITDSVQLLQDSRAWTASADQALKEWMGAYLTWLRVSSRGRTQATRGNNQETWYFVQVVALALYTGQTQVARTALEDARAGISRQIEPDGRQPRELERTRAWDYSIFNLSAYLNLAELGARVGVDLWNHRAPGGSSLRTALEFLVPFATGQRRFPYQQIGEFRPSALHGVLRRAAVGWNEPRYRELARQIGGGTQRLALTLP